MIADIVSIVLLLAGCAFFAAGTLGLLRFPDSNSRLHALTKADNLGLGLVVAGLIVHAAAPAVALKLLLIWALALLAAATSGHLLASGVDATERSEAPEGSEAGNPGRASGQPASNQPASGQQASARRGEPQQPGIGGQR